MNQEKPTPQVLTKVFLDSEGKDAARLGEHGFTNKFIAQQTGLSEGQVQYRLTLAGIKRRSFRNGETAEAKRVAKLPMSSALSRKIDRLCKDIDDLIRKDNRRLDKVGREIDQLREKERKTVAVIGKGLGRYLKPGSYRSDLV